MAMAVEALYALRKLLGKLFSKHSETAAGSTGIVKFSLYLAIFRINAQAIGNRMLAKTLTDRT